MRNRPVPYRQISLYNRYYLHAPAASNLDPTLVMGTEIDADVLQSFLLERNRDGRVLITAAHALVRATAMALVQFPEMNVRVVGRRIYAFRDVNIRIAFFHRQKGETDLLLIKDASIKSLEQIGKEIWQRLLQAGRGGGDRDRDLARMRRIPGFWLRQILRLYGLLDRHFRMPTLGRLDELRGGCATVNDLSFPGAPPMRSYKPSRFPDESDSLNLTLGPIETKVVSRSDHFVSARVMPLFVRADHRLVDAYQLGRFLAALRNLLNQPERLDLRADQPAMTSALSESSEELKPDRFISANQ
jgi:pyruvate/2-oxoglutarate dehydrogenase complex dihydrolipoamide acyltransferase (E2) component